MTDVKSLSEIHPDFGVATVKVSSQQSISASETGCMIGGEG